MAHVRNCGSAKAVTFKGPVERGPHMSGVVSTAGWHNPHLMAGLRQIFKCQDHEVITAIVIDDDGISAKFERMP